ncbi:hypothetical protein NUW58_g4729 [Xylaria curta]|uniref:Uncharacterized protein n=1 Tax=Xylaria curta TaxID=42375 RepID=A0ACC1P6D8_9PEZI|nr:hypothetical protein NUW58_g4729 [Xylaria curta]
MAFNVFMNAGTGAYFTVLIVAGLLCSIAVTLRFMATRANNRKPAWEDWFALAAVAVFLTRIGVVLCVLVVINGRGIDLVDDRVAYEKAFKLIYVAEMITILDQTLAKLSICALYLRIFGINRIYAYYIWLLGILQVAVNIALIIVQFLQCRPLNKFWQYWADGTCISSFTLLASVEPFNSVIDFALVILALVMIRSLNMSRKTKWRLRFLFGLGSLAGVLGFIKIGVTHSSDLAYATVALGLWAAVQSLACIVCCCAPVYKSLVVDVGVWNRIASKLSAYRSRNGSKTSGPESASKTGRQGSSDEEALRTRAWLPTNTSTNISTAWDEPSLEHPEHPYTASSTPSIYVMSSVRVHRSTDTT